MMRLLTRQSPEEQQRRVTLRLTPVLRPTARVETNEKTTRVIVRHQRGQGFFDRFRPTTWESCYELDNFGCFLLGLIDGRRSVLELIRIFADHFHLSRRECELGVVAFLKMLLQRRVIDVADPVADGG